LEVRNTGHSSVLRRLWRFARYPCPSSTNPPFLYHYPYPYPSLRPRAVTTIFTPNHHTTHRAGENVVGFYCRLRDRKQKQTPKGEHVLVGRAWHMSALHCLRRLAPESSLAEANVSDRCCFCFARHVGVKQWSRVRKGGWRGESIARGRYIRRWR